MRARHLFEYAVVRLVPRVEREEFVNIGVVVYCAQLRYLRAAFALDRQRLGAFAPGFDLAAVEPHLHSFERICAGDAAAGPIARLPAGERFRWLTAPRSTVLQTSPVHTGLWPDADAALERLLERLVR